jgi:signal transduction histidine kinase
MKKALKLISFLLFFCCSVNAQKSKIDSLKSLLTMHLTDKARVQTMLDIADLSVSLPEQLQLAQASLELSEKIRYDSGKLMSLFVLALRNSVNGNWAKGMELAYKGEDAAIEKNDSSFELSFMNIIALSYRKQKDFTTGLSWSRRVISALNNGYPNDGYNECAAYMQCADFFSAMQQPDSAIIYGNKGIDAVVKKQLSPKFSAYSYQYKANAFTQLEKFDSAIVNYIIALKLLQGDPFGEQEVEIDFAQMYFNMKDFNNAEKYAISAYNGASETTNPHVMIDAAALLVKIYEPQNKLKAYSYLQTYLALKDSIFNKEKYNQIYKIDFEEKKKIAEKEKAAVMQLNKEKQKKFILIIVLLALMAAGFAFLTRQKQKANILLNKEKQKVEQTLKTLTSTQAQLIQSEKMASLGELTAGIAHEIQNPLNFVNNFSEVNKELLAEMNEEIENKNFDEVKALAKDITDNEEKIIFHGKRADAIVKGMLQHSRSTSSTKEPTDINKLADEYLRLAYHGLRAKDKSFNATLKTDFDNSIGNINIIPQDIGRVILNLITNAFYVVDEKKKLGIENYEPTVSVTTKKVGDKVLISVKDNGNGIPQKILDKIFQPFFTTKPTGQGTGLGLSLSYDIVKAHGGELKLETKEGEGSEFIIQLPII